MNIQSAETNTTQLMTLLEHVKPIFSELGKIISESKKLNSEFKNDLSQLNLNFKIDSSTKENTLMTEKEVEKKVNNIIFVFDRLGEIITNVSNDNEESKLFLETGIMDKLLNTSQRLSELLH